MFVFINRWLLVHDRPEAGVEVNDGFIAPGHNIREFQKGPMGVGGCLGSRGQTRHQVLNSG